MNSFSRRRTVSLHLPVSTILTILVTLLLIHLVEGLAVLIMPLFIASFVAVTLHPILIWLEKKRIPKWLAMMVIVFGLMSGLVGVMAVLVPQMIHEFQSLVQNLPQIKAQILSSLSDQNPLRAFIEHNLTRKALFPNNYDVANYYSVGTTAFGGIAEVILVFVFSVYLVVDGPRLIEWGLAFFSPEKTTKLRQTLEEVSEIVFAYASGQFITSILSFLYSFAVLSLLKVPGALLLAMLAGIFDVLPVLGFFLAVVPAMIFSMRISVETSLYVLLLYLAYHALENYVLVPWVYGNRLRLSGLTVLLATLGAGYLAGVEGAISVLPLIASYPVIEKIWLKRYVGQEAVDEHERLDQEKGDGKKRGFKKATSPVV